MSDVRDTLSELAKADRRGAVWCGCLCAMTVQHLVPVGEHRPATALRLAMLWAQGVPVSERRLRSAANATIGAASATIGAAASAANAAAASAATAAATAAANANAAYANAHAYTAWREARRWHLDWLGALVDHQLTFIAPEDSGHHPLWDWTMEHCPAPCRVGSLGDALKRARRWRLKWWVPHERAIAERLVELPRWAQRSENSKALSHLVQHRATAHARADLQSEIPGA